MCELARIPVTCGDNLRLIRFCLSVARVPVLVTVRDFVIRATGPNGESGLSPEPSDECTLFVGPKPQLYGPDVYIETEDDLRFHVATSSLIGNEPIWGITALEARIAVDDQVELFLSCGGAPRCDACAKESSAQDG